MARTLTSAVSDALAADHVPLAVFIEMDFASGFLRVNNSAQTLAWDSKTWCGAGGLLAVSPVAESGDLEAHAVSIELAGIDPYITSGSPSNVNLADAALQEHYQGRQARLWFAPLDSGYAVLADPKLVFDGRMNTLSIGLGETLTLKLLIESRLLDWERPRVRRYNDADQRREYAGDRFFEFMERVVEKTLVWGFPLPPAQQQTKKTITGPTTIGRDGQPKAVPTTYVGRDGQTKQVSQSGGSRLGHF